jgi:hypothetical protein
MLPEYARFRSYKSGKQSSYDRTGGNTDFRQLSPGETIEIFSQSGPGVITHIWLTIGSGDVNALKDLVFRAYWDGNALPSVEVPVGDFFGLNLNQYTYYESAFLNCTPLNALNCYFAMPFQSFAELKIKHEGPAWRVSPDRGGREYNPPLSLYWNIDYRLENALPADRLYFHAQYRQQTPTKAVLPTVPNLTGEHNYVFAEVHGCGHLMGVTWGVQQLEPNWFGEGDDMTFIDDSLTLHGTGAEDYINGAWDFGCAWNDGRCFANRYSGAPLVPKGLAPGGLYQMYRWHADNPIVFTTYLKHTIEHGDENNRTDNYYSVCYWYQTEPYTDFPPLPPAVDRIPPPFQIIEPAKSGIKP